VALEAQAMGVPIVAADVGGVKETIHPNYGELVKEDASEAFCDALENIRLRGPDFDSQKALMAFVRTRFGHDRVASDLRELYSLPL
jgi:glycosyltransferase involved in cell wall biosynthesis